MKKIIKLDLDVYEKLLVHRTKLIGENGKNITFSETIRRLLQNANS